MTVTSVSDPGNNTDMTAPMTGNGHAYTFDVNVAGSGTQPAGITFKVSTGTVTVARVAVAPADATSRRLPVTLVVGPGDTLRYVKDGTGSVETVNAIHRTSF